MGSDEGGVKRRKAAALREDGEPFALCDKGTTCRLSKEQWEKGETNLAFTLESTFRERERERESVCVCVCVSQQCRDPDCRKLTSVFCPGGVARMRAGRAGPASSAFCILALGILGSRSVYLL